MEFIFIYAIFRFCETWANNQNTITERSFIVVQSGQGTLQASKQGGWFDLDMFSNVAEKYDHSCWLLQSPILQKVFPKESLAK